MWHSRQTARTASDSAADDAGEADAFRRVLRITLDPWSIRVVEERAPDDGATYLASEAETRQLDEGLLLRIYNAVAGSELRRFPRHSAAAKMTWGVVQSYLGSTQPGAELAVRPEDAAQDGASPTDGSDARAVLREEIREMRERLAAKVTELRILEGRGGPAETPTVTKALELLRSEEGATKERLVRETGAKKGYVDALLGRILPQKGYAIASRSVPGQQAKTYFIDTEPGAGMRRLDVSAQ